MIPARLVLLALVLAAAASDMAGAAEKGLVYVLTVLARDGKVTEAMVDASDGHWLDGS